MVNLFKRLGIVLVVAFLIPFIGWLGLAFLSLTEPSPPKPQIRWGEFPFRLEYKLNDELIVIEDTVIANYKGINHFSNSGKHRKWKQYLASDKKEVNVLLLQLDDGSQLYYNVGGAGYYMEGGQKAPNTYESFNSVYMQTNGNQRLVRPEELLNDFGIELIKWEESPPIENSFK